MKNKGKQKNTKYIFWLILYCILSPKSKWKTNPIQQKVEKNSFKTKKEKKLFDKNKEKKTNTFQIVLNF